MKHRPRQLSHARHLRRRQTDAERELWQQLRAGRIIAAKFRRQEPIGAFVVDFSCFDPKLVIEIDGGQHVAQCEADARRTAFLERSGYQVLRFWNNDVLGNLDGVIGRIAVAVASLREEGAGAGGAEE